VIKLNNGLIVPTYEMTMREYPILEHMAMSKLERQEHTNIEAPCTRRGCKPTTNYIQNRYPRMSLASFLGTEIPEGYYLINGKKTRIEAAHICDYQCFNPLHMYWATTLENAADKKIDYYKLLNAL